MCHKRYRRRSRSIAYRYNPSEELAAVLGDMVVGEYVGRACVYPADFSL